MKGEGKTEIAKDTEICRFRDWGDDGCLMNQDGMCRKKSPGKEDHAFYPEQAAFEGFVRSLKISAINNISCTEKIVWVC